jgi:hypothetical protein
LQKLLQLLPLILSSTLGMLLPLLPLLLLLLALRKIMLLHVSHRCRSSLLQGVRLKLLFIFHIFYPLLLLLLLQGPCRVSPLALLPKPRLQPLLLPLLLLLQQLPQPSLPLHVQLV